ncbi:MAG: hypothetical protein ACK41T_13090 [Pseudobdellovibrio sp.]
MSSAFTEQIHDGPNCFNTVLVAKGYTDTLAYSSESEFNFYIKNFCQEDKNIQITQAPKNTVLTLSTNDKRYIHTALTLNNAKILEKNSLYGSNTPAFTFLDPAPGKYLIHSLKDSYFFTDDLYKNQKRSVYVCKDENLTRKAMHLYYQNPSIKPLIDFQKIISLALKLQTREDIENYTLKTILPYYKSKIQTTLSMNLEDSKLKELRYSLAMSTAYQWNLFNCSDDLKKYDDCNIYTNPKMKDSIELLDSWYQQIYNIKPQWLSNFE